MPPKDDEEPKTTKEVVTKKHKQMLNREELDLSLIAEAFGGVLITEDPKFFDPGGVLEKGFLSSPEGERFKRTADRIRKTGPTTVRVPVGDVFRKSLQGLYPELPKGTAAWLKNFIDTPKSKPRSKPRTAPSVISPTRVTQPSSAPPNAASQPKVNPQDITKLRARQTPTTIPSASGGDAGAAVRQAMQQRAAAVKPPVVKPTSVLGRLKGVRPGSPASMIANLVVGAALDKYVVEPVAKAGGDALARTVYRAAGKEKRAQQVYPSLYGKYGPDVTPEMNARAKAEMDARAKAEAKPQTQTAAPPAAAPPKVKVDTKGEEPKEAPKPKPTPKTIPGAKIGPGGFQITPTKPTRRGDKKGRFRLPGLGFPQQPGGVIGRRQNPQ